MACRTSESIARRDGSRPDYPRSVSSADLDLWQAPYADAPVEAVVPVPGSKSLTNRALVLAALADGPSTVRDPLRSRDTLLMAAALRALGTRIEARGQDWYVVPGAFRGPAE